MYIALFVASLLLLVLEILLVYSFRHIKEKNAPSTAGKIFIFGRLVLLTFITLCYAYILFL